MNFASSLDRLVLRSLALCLFTSFVAGCMASAAITVVSQTVKTTAKAAGTAARVTMTGARAASDTVTRPLRKSSDEAPNSVG